MPSAAEHQAKYAANRRLLDTGNGGASLSTTDPCWAAVVAFYAALHLVDRLAARAGIHPDAHAKRVQFVTARHGSILKQYADLMTASSIARYGTLNQFARTYSSSVVQDVLIDQHLTAIEAYVAAAFNPPLSTGGAGVTSGS